MSGDMRFIKEVWAKDFIHCTLEDAEIVEAVLAEIYDFAHDKVSRHDREDAILFYFDDAEGFKDAVIASTPESVAKILDDNGYTVEQAGGKRCINKFIRNLKELVTSDSYDSIQVDGSVRLLIDID